MSAIDAALASAADVGDFASAYALAEASEAWAQLDAPSTPLFPWNPASTYIRRPPFAGFGKGTRLGTYKAQPILVLGDDITTDHISPAGQISASSEAGRYLTERGDNPKDLNVFASRRGNWEAMLRGLFTNKSVKNLLAAGLPAGSTVHAGSGETMSLPRAAARYESEDQSVVIVAGERYGMGSSRDWAAKGTALLGARAVLASSFERIHRSNLINMGILPLRLPSTHGPRQLNLRPGDTISISADARQISPRGPVQVVVTRPGRNDLRFEATAAIETRLETTILESGGMLPFILNRCLEESPQHQSNSAVLAAKRESKNA
jgi:aconitate hydratase